MGECSYFLKAKFASHEKALVAAESLGKTLAEVGEAYAFWQANRGKKNREEFWAEFEGKFPLAIEVLKLTRDVEVGGDCHNGLAGKLSYCDQNASEVEVDGNEVKYSALVWHMADWDGLADWIKSALKAKAVTWASEEMIDPFDGLDYAE